MPRIASVGSQGLAAAVRDVRRLTLGPFIRARAQDRPHETAITDGAAQVSFAELDLRTERLADALSALGVGRGDRIATLLLDGLPAVEFLIAAGKLGAIDVTLNWRLAPMELSRILASAAPRLLVHSECFADLAVASLAAAGEIQRIAVSEVTSDTGTYAEWVAGAPPRRREEVYGDDPLYMLYTSGTTGTPKGCLQSHEGTIIAGWAFAARRGISRADRLLSTAPLFHVGGLSHLFAALAVGAAAVIAPRGYQPRETLHLLSRTRCTFGAFNDALLEGMIEHQQSLQLPLCLRTVTRGASLTTATQIHAIRAHLGAETVGGYGQSEVGGFATMLDGDEMLVLPSALGAPLAHLEVALLDADGRPDSAAAVGEIGLRGPGVMLGYWSDPRATKEAIGTGWLRTGDLARRDAAGMLHFEGRTKELVKTGGENVYPREVEQVLRKHPQIRDAAIVGVPDARWGEAVKACIVLEPGAVLSSREAAVWCKEHIAGYKRPRYVEYVDAIPRDTLGKIQRPLLRQRRVTPDQIVD